MDGGSLKGSHIPHEKEVANITFQVLSALSYLHTRKLVHRDLKPSNLLINSRKEVKISDFGLSMILRHTMDSCKSSDIAYMSPERISTDLYSAGIYDGYAGDIWSLGLCILQVYSGAYPFEVVLDTDWGSLVDAICGTETPEAPLEASKGVSGFHSMLSAKRSYKEMDHRATVAPSFCCAKHRELQTEKLGYLGALLFFHPIKLLCSLAC